MSGRCASCHYPLSVSDSVACIECTSHFHIDCAQLVGFPLFEFSAEPDKNVFHCSTCKLLPLPVPRGDSDTSDDEGMPSRQLDFSLEGDSDCGKNMNEVKGSIQDLSDLCKDMLREINDLKSINLTLRCCIENLRHDNEKRDDVISELKRRLDLLEENTFKGNIVETFNQLSETENKTAMCLDDKMESIKLGIDESLIHNTTYSKKSAAYKQELFSNYTTTSKEETEGYELEETSLKEERSESSIKSSRYDQKSAAYKQELFSSYMTTSKEETEGYELEETSSFWEKGEDSQQSKSDNEKKQLEDAEIGYSDDEKDKKNEKQSEKSIDQDKVLVKAEIVSEANENRQDWSWKGSHAIEVSKQDDDDDNQDEEEEESEEDDSEEDSVIVESPSWQKLKEEIESAIKEEDSVESSVVIEALDTEENEESWRVRKSVTWDENIEDESETEAEFSQRDHKHGDQSEAETDTLADEDMTSVDDVGSVTDVEDRSEVGEEEFRLESRASTIIEEEQRLETDEFFSEERPTLETSEEHAEGESRVEGDGALAEGEPHKEEKVTRLEGDVSVDVEPRLEGDVTVDVEPRLEGDVSVDVEPRLEGDVSVDVEPRLEGDVTIYGEPRLDEDLTLDGEPRLEGDVLNGEYRQDGEGVAEEDLRLKEIEVHDDEEVLPPESPPPVHTEEDLWLYLKENVSSERPSTVEEFVKNLIGTLQHVPEEYLKPVIDANIKRANSPSVTDGEHPPSPEGVRPEDGLVSEEGHDTNNVNPLETSDSTGADFPASTQEVSTEFPVSSALEATD